MSEPRTIWKFPFRIADNVTLLMPAGAQLLHVGPSNEPGRGDLCLWALVYPEQGKVQRHLNVYGTGHQVDHRHHKETHVGTVELGAFVWHVFDAGESR